MNKTLPISLHYKVVCWWTICTAKGAQIIFLASLLVIRELIWIDWDNLIEWLYLAQERERSIRGKKGSIKRKSHHKLTTIKIYVFWFEVTTESFYFVVRTQTPMKKLQIAKVVR